MADIKNSRILIIATNGFEQKELEVPRDKLREAGAKVDVASPDGKAIMGWDEKDWGSEAEVDLKIADARSGDYHVLVIPGGVLNPDKLNHLWWSPIMPVYFFVSSIAAGIALVVLVELWIAKAWDRPVRVAHAFHGRLQTLPDTPRGEGGFAVTLRRPS